MRERPDLETLPHEQLLRGLFDVLRQTRHDEVRLVAQIAEVDARELYAREASASMFAWCTERLHLSEAEAYLRIGAARASRRHPMLLAMPADGRIHLSGIERLAPHLTDENRDVLPKRAVHRTKRQIEELAAEVAPRPANATRLRRLPARPGPEGGRQWGETFRTPSKRSGEARRSAHDGRSPPFGRRASSGRSPCVGLPP